MGFFSSSQTTTTNENYMNDPLARYSNAYRAVAPWGFATLDPTATLAAMGKGTKVGGAQLGQNFKDYLSSLSGDEKKQAAMTNDALARIQQRQESGQFLTPQETDFINQSLDKAFEYANTTGMRDITLQAQALAGRQGLRTSDTPVATQALQATRDLALGIGSARASQGLQATMGMAAQQNEFDKSFAEFNQNLQASRQNSRLSFLFGGGLSGASNIAYNKTDTSKVTGNPSGFQQFMGGLQMANGVLDLGQRVGGMVGGLPGGAPKAPGGGSMWGS